MSGLGEKNKKTKKTLLQCIYLVFMTLIVWGCGVSDTQASSATTHTHKQMQRAALTETHIHIDPPLSLHEAMRGSHSFHHPAPTDLLSHCFSVFLCWVLTDTHTWLKSVHYQHDAAGLNEAGLIAAKGERIDAVHTKKSSIHKCTGRRLLLQHMLDSFSVTTTKEEWCWIRVPVVPTLFELCRKKAMRIRSIYNVGILMGKWTPGRY